MKRFWIITTQVITLCLATPGAYSGDAGTYGQDVSWKEGGIEGNKGNWRNRGNGKGKPLEDAEAEAAAQSISFVIGYEAGAEQTRYLDYSRRLATTLNQKSKAEVAAIVGSSKTYGLGR